MTEQQELVRDNMDKEVIGEMGDNCKHVLIITFSCFSLTPLLLFGVNINICTNMDRNTTKTT